MAKEKKGLRITLITLVSVIVFLLIFPSVGSSILSLFSPKLCTEAQFAFNCVCPIGFDKVRNPFTRPIVYSCIKSVEEIPFEFPISFDNPDYESEVFSFAKQYLRQNFATCNTINCESPKFKEIWKVTAPDDNEIGMIECLEQQTEGGGRVFWRVAFDLDDGSLIEGISTYCFSE